MPALWVKAVLLLLYGWLPAGIAWQLLNQKRIDAFSMLGWFLWPVVPVAYLGVALWRQRRAGRRS